MSDHDTGQADTGGCVMCGGALSEPLTAELTGAGGLSRLSVCGPGCLDQARRLAGRYRANLRPALASHVVSGLGLVAGALFVLFERELGWVLLLFALFALGTTRLAYPEVVPPALLKRHAAARVIEAFQWLGVAACAAALLGGLLLLLG